MESIASTVIVSFDRYTIWALIFLFSGILDVSFHTFPVLRRFITIIVIFFGVGLRFFSRNTHFFSQHPMILIIFFDEIV